MGLPNSEAYELRRMLAAFKADLPPHELGWFITKHPDEFLVEDSTGKNWASPPLGLRWQDWFTVKGYAHCLRCGERFDIPSGLHTSQDSLDETVSRAKERVIEKALGSGPCWADVPRPPRERERGAVMDSIERDPA